MTILSHATERIHLSPPLARAFRLLPVAWLIMLGIWPCLGMAHAQGLVLRSSPRLQEALTPEESRRGSMHIQAERIGLRPDMDATIEGQVILRKPGLVIRADRLDYDQTRDHLRAQGEVRVIHKGNVFEGPEAELQLDSFQGQFEKPRYWLFQGGYGDAQRLEFIDENRIAVQQARYTTCRATPGPEWLPEWLIKATRIQTDMAEGVGVAQDVQLHFMGMSTPPLPDVRFPIESNRASGLLSPVVAIDSISGIDYMQPYYWDIAPNRDATLIGRTMSRRGIGLEGELRYLENNYAGQVRLNWLPHDALRKENRWGLMTQHNGTVDSGIGALGLGLSINRVSDDNYWRDFPRSYLGASGTTSALGAPAGLMQRVLPSTGTLSWARDGFSVVGLVQRWQTQQDLTDITKAITPPYDRAPQLTMRYGRWNSNGMDWSIVADTTRFEADYSRLPTGFATLRNGTRSYTQAQVSRPFVAPWGYVIPRLQVHATRYDMQSPLDNGSTSVNRVLPTFSLDSGLVFERETGWFGRGLVQTLEPRVFYARTAFQDQSFLPLYDTGTTDFNLSTIYSDNPYVGHDRIVDNNAITLGVNSRWFDNSSGAELLRMGVAQRLRLADQRVSLNAPGATEDQKGLSDLLLGLGLRWSDPLWLDSTLQLNNLTHTVQRSTLQLRYNPGPYRLVNAAYRLSKNITSPSEMVDLGWQWPLSDLSRNARVDDSGIRIGGQGLGADRWYSVGRLNYSVQDRQLVNALLGFEYDAGCWLARVAFERLQNTVTASNTRLMFQLELVGFGRVGVSPLDSLKRNIPRYQYLRETTTTPSRFLNYE